MEVRVLLRFPISHQQLHRNGYQQNQSRRPDPSSSHLDFGNIKPGRPCRIVAICGTAQHFTSDSDQLLPFTTTIQQTLLSEFKHTRDSTEGGGSHVSLSSMFIREADDLRRLQARRFRTAAFLRCLLVRAEALVCCSIKLYNK